MTHKKPRSIDQRVITFSATGPLVAASALILAIAPAAKASTANSTSSSQTTSALAEIVVTAQRVASNLQRTPVSMSVLSGKTLAREDIHDITSLTQITPSVQITGSGPTTLIAMRGISSRDTSDGGDPAVVVSNDWFYQDRTYTLGLVNYDLDRVEILRGPQGTLYGRNATGGAINIITNKPVIGQTSGDMDVAVTDYQGIDTDGDVNLPVDDRAALRFSYTSQSHEGYRSLGAVGRADDQDAKSARAQLQFNPTDRLKLHLLLEKTIQNASGPAPDMIPFTVNAQGIVQHTAPANIGQQPFPFVVTPTLDVDQTMTRWDAHYTLPFANVSYYGGYATVDFKSRRGEQSSWSGPAGTPDLTQTQQPYVEHEHPDTINQELRFSSPTQNGLIAWQGGLFYFKADNLVDNQTLGGTQPGLYSPLNNERLYDYETISESKAAYGQVSLHATDKLTFSAGLRYTADNKTRNGAIYVGSAYTPSPQHLDYTDHNLTYHFGVDEQLTGSTMLYAKVDTGYKAGGFDLSGAYFAPEKAVAEEMGVKTEFLDRHVIVDADAFHTSYKGLQESVFGTSPLSITTTVNAGSARFYGMESNIEARIPVVGTLGLEADFLKAQFLSLVVSDPIYQWVGSVFKTTNQNVNLAGNSPPQAPEWTLGAHLDHSWSIWKGAVTARAETKFVSQQHFTIFNFPDDEQKSYTMTNLSLEYEDDANWTVEAFVHNVENSLVLSQGYEISSARAIVYNFLPPRTYGVRAAYSF